MMAGGKDLGLPKRSFCSLKDQLAMKTLHHVRKQGHTYVELREDGKRLVFFCTLCLSPCYSDSILFDHLKGSLHTERLAAAKATLLKPNPWPFNDGLLFFTDPEQDKPSPDSNCDQTRVISIDWNDDDDDTLAIVKYDKTLLPDICEDAGDADSKKSTPSRTEGKHQIVIPNVLCRDKISEVVATDIGIGKIAARVREKDGVSNEVHRIWCEWLGIKESCDEEEIMIPVHDFALVIFPYNNSLGRQSLLEETRCLLPPRYLFESDKIDNAKSLKRKSLSDPEDISGSISNQCDSSGSRIVLHDSDDHLPHSRAVYSKTLMQQPTKKHEVVSVRTCGICQQNLLLGKDVATLMNMNVGRLACSSRNMTGAFHVYHTSCLIQWVLLCELEMHGNQSDGPPTVKQKSRKKAKPNHNGERKNGGRQIDIPSIFCPECQGTGTMIAEDNLEKPTVSLSQMYVLKIKLTDARKEWINSPETLSNCSTGFTFPPLSGDLCEEHVTALKLLHFYRADA